MVLKGIGPDYSKTGVEKNIMYWWIGQVTDEAHWIPNEVRVNTDRDGHPGWGRRYRVRIFSRDAQVKVVPDDELETATVIVPVTAGSGHEGYGESICLAQGSFVLGFYLDGPQGREPIIIGAIPNNSQNRLFGGDPEVGFIPRTGYKGLTGDKKVSTKNIYLAPGSHPNKEDTNTSPNTRNVSGEDKLSDGSDIGPRKKNIECEGGGGPVQGIQGHIQRALAMIQRIKQATNSFLGAASQAVANIENIVNSVSSAVSSLFKLIVTKMRGFVIRKLNQAIAFAGSLIPPNLRQVFAFTSFNSVDTLACVFNKIIGTLFEMAKGLIGDIVNNYVMAPMCAAEKLVGDMIGNILGDVTGAIDQAVSSIQGLIDTAGDIAGGIFSVMDIVQGLLNFLKCDATPNCKYLDEWSFWNGSSEAKAVSEGLGNFLSDVANNLDETLGTGGGGGGGCNTDQVPCGPPSISFTGGGGTGIAANPIVSTAGQLMGLDFSDLGGGYTSSPGVSVNSPCSGGGGASVKLLTTSDGVTSSESWKQGDNIQVTGSVVTHPGSGYNASPNGDTNISKKEQTIVRDEDGTRVIDPGKTINVKSPAKAYIPPGEQVDVYDDDGNLIQEIIGEGALIAIDLPDGGNFTTPTPPDYTGPGAGVFDFTGTPPENPEINIHYINNTTGNGNWDGFTEVPVRANDIAIFNGTTWELLGSGSDNRPISGGEKVDVVLDGVFIENRGVNYEQGDQIIMEPNYGANLIPVFNDIGQLEEVIITDPGSLFEDYPRIYIKSQTGINANILPIFKVRREDEDPDQTAKTLSGERIITVDDCIGRLIIGYVNGQPYYGPFHTHMGRKMVGAKHTTTPHAYIYDTPEQSLRNPYYVRKSIESTTTSYSYTTPTTPQQESPDGDVLVDSQISEPSGSTPNYTSASSTSPAPAPASVSAPAPSPAPAPAPPPAPSPSPGGGYGGY